MVELSVSRLTVADHRRDIAGFTYVYPVVSRRAGGVSIGINLNPNNACNWRCVYCQVENLARGSAPVIDVGLLEQELEAMLQAVLHGDFLQKHVPEGAQRINDIAFSGNGEPTTAAEFQACIDVAIAALQRHRLLGQIKIVLITNGSQMHRAKVREGLRRMAAHGGEVWFKLDRGSSPAMWATNQIRQSPAQVERRLALAAGVCPTWVQTCFFAWDGQDPGMSEIEDYLSALKNAIAHPIALQGVLLYGVARPSMQSEAQRISKVSPGLLQAIGHKIAELGLSVKIHD